MQQIICERKKTRRFYTKQALIIKHIIRRKIESGNKFIYTQPPPPDSSILYVCMILRGEKAKTYATTLSAYFLRTSTLLPRHSVMVLFGFRNTLPLEKGHLGVEQC